MEDSKVSVLVIDDEKGLASALQQYLTRCGYNASMETDGQRAVDFYKANRPGISLIDVLLDVDSIDGIEVLKRIREINSEAICIMTTRITDEATVKKAKELGALHYVLKPLSGQDIVDIVNEAAQVLNHKGDSHG